MYKINKLLALALVSLLASCSVGGTPSPEKVLLDSQKNIVSSMADTFSPIKIGETTGTVGLDIDASNMSSKISIKGDISAKYDTDKQIGEGDIALKGDYSILPLELVGKLDFGMSFISSAEKLFAKLSKFELSSNGDEGIKQNLPPQITEYIGKWLMLKKDINGTSEFNPSKILVQQKEILKAIISNKILKQTKVNKDKDYYNYDVAFDYDGILNLVKDITKINNDVKFTEEDIAPMKDEIAKLSLVGNIKINKNNKNYIVFNGTVSHSTSDQSLTISLTNSKDRFTLMLSPKGGKDTFTFIVDKTLKKGTIKLLDFSAGFSYDLSKEKTYFKLDISNPIIATLLIDLNTKKISTFEVKEPEDYKDITNRLLNKLKR